MTSAAEGEDLLDELGGLLSRLDPVPPQLLEQSRRLFCWRSIDGELAELSFDSLVDQGALAVRSGEEALLEPRMLCFAAVVDGEDLSIELEVSTLHGECTMMGQLSPATAAGIVLHAGDGAITDVPVDEVGRFLIRPVPAGPLRLEVRHAGHLVKTTWVSYTS